MTKRFTTLPKTLAACGTPAFVDVLKLELEQLDPAVLPLQEGLSRGSYVSGDTFQVMVIRATESAGVVSINAGIHYQSIIAGCSCADDPTPIDDLSEYCEVDIVLDTVSGSAEITLSGE